jgi:trigger factor
MQYVTEDLNPVKKKITVVFPAEEVNAAFATAVSTLRGHVRLNGFRPGKVPAEIIEKRFFDDVRRQVSKQLIDDHGGKIIEAGDFHVLSPIECDGGRPERGREFSYSMTFEVMPEFEVPDYRGMPVEQEEAVVTDDDVDELLLIMREKAAKLILVEEDRTLQDGDLAFADWVLLDEEGAAMPDYEVNSKFITVGHSGKTPEVEILLKSMKRGEEKEGSVTFPPDYQNEVLAGRTLGIRIKVYSIRTRVLPEPDDAFAKQCNGVADIAQLRDTLRSAALKGMEERNRTAAQKKLVNELARHTDFPLPDCVVTDAVNMYLDEFKARAREMGATETPGETALDDMRAKVRPYAEQWARNHLLLLNAARKMGLSVGDRALSERLRFVAERSGRDYTVVKDAFELNNLLPKLRNELLAEKAMNEIYAAAAVTMLPPAPQETAESSENNAAPSAPAATVPDEEQLSAPAAAAPDRDQLSAPAATVPDEEQFSAPAAAASDEEQLAPASPAPAAEDCLVNLPPLS